MKKVMMMIAVVMMAATSVNAQNGYEDTKHEVAISGGILSNSQIIDIYEDAFMAMTGATYDDGEFTGPISAEYFYHIKSWLNVGAIFTYGMFDQDVYLGKVKEENHIGKGKNKYYTLMPAVKLNWLRKKYFGMYSKAGIGATLRSEKTNYDDGKNNYSHSSVHINWQASLLGIEAGSPTVRGFVEGGFGEQGILQAGIRCKF